MMGRYLKQLRAAGCPAAEFRQELRSQHEFADRASECLTSRVRVNTASIVGLSIAIGAFGLRILIESADWLQMLIASFLGVAGILVYYTAYQLYSKESLAVDHWREISHEIGFELGYLIHEEFRERLLRPFEHKERPRKGTYLRFFGIAYACGMLLIFMIAWMRFLSCSQ